jgi:carbon storage regulator
MLVFRRRVQETFVIAGAVRVTILGVEGRTVRVGITAPKTIPVHREEVLDEQGVAKIGGAASAKAKSRAGA